MLLSIALILLVGMCMSWICQKIKLPGLLGMLATGVVLGPYVDKSRAWAGSVRTEENRKIRSDDVLCPCKL